MLYKLKILEIKTITDTILAYMHVERGDFSNGPSCELKIKR